MKGLKKQRLAGWILSGILAAFLIGPSALGKIMEWEGKAAMLETMGFSSPLMVKIGIVEILLAILFLVPRSGFLGAILLTGYLGGAVVTHVRMGEPVFIPVLFGVAVWVALGLRMPQVFSLTVGTSHPPESDAG